MNLIDRVKWLYGTDKKAVKLGRGNRPLEMILRQAPTGGIAWYNAKGTDLMTNGYLGNNVVFSIQDWKSQKVALPPPLVYKVVNEQKYHKYKALMKSDDVRKGYQKAMRLKEQSLQEVEGTELAAVLQNPNPHMGWSEFAYGHTVYKDINGSAYWAAVRNGIDDPTEGKIMQIYLLPAHHVVIKSGGITELIKEYFLDTAPDTPIDAKNVCQIRNFSPLFETPYQHLYGLSRLHAANPILQKYNEGNATEVDVFQKRGVRDLVFPKGTSDFEEITAEQTQTAKDRFNQDLRTSGHGGVMMGNIELGSIRIGLSPTELGILESNKISKQDFCALYHIPYELFPWGDRSTYNNLSESRKIALTDAVIPELEAIKDAINRWLVPSHYPNGGYVVDFDYEYFPELQDDIKDAVAWMKEAGCLTVNEKRDVLRYGASKDPNADRVLVPSTMRFLDELGLESFEPDPQAAKMFEEGA